MSVTADAYADQLVRARLSERERDRKSSLFDRALSALRRDRDFGAWWVPGRIEFLGKHTDYAGGPSLLCAVERGLAVAAAPRDDSRVSICDAVSGQRVEAPLSPGMSVRQNHWSNYPLTVCRRVARNFSGLTRGVDIAFASDLPSAAGLSSSSALIVATFLALADANDLASRPEYRAEIHGDEDLAGYLGAIENGGGFHSLLGDRGVGTQGGSQDHTAILCARAHTLVQYRCAPMRFERAIALPNDHRFVIGVSGVVASKTGNARALYNRAAERAAEALRVWRQATDSAARTLAAALAEGSDAMDQFREVLAERRELLERVEQFAEETALVQAAGDALQHGDLDRLGSVVDRSQACAERWLGNQTPETVELARSARALGAVAASAFGAGFGGSVYALVPGEFAADFRDRWAERYAVAFPKRRARATFFVSGAGPAAIKL